jgi:8-oxo-dGTP diphosphatase
VEADETVETAAVRELTEETGAIDFQMDPVVSYEGSYQGKQVFGKIFYAKIKELGPLPAHEICETRLFDEMPLKLTYPGIQPHFFKQVLEWLDQQPCQPLN